MAPLCAAWGLVKNAIFQLQQGAEVKRQENRHSIP